MILLHDLRYVVYASRNAKIGFVARGFAGIFFQVGSGWLPRVFPNDLRKASQRVASGVLPRKWAQEGFLCFFSSKQLQEWIQEGLPGSGFRKAPKVFPSALRKAS